MEFIDQDGKDVFGIKDCIEWIFSGIGVEIFKIVISLIVGAFAGYKIGVKKTINQKQVAGDISRQIQKAVVNDKEKEKVDKKENSIKQKQKAGDNALQIQTGRIE